MRKHILLIIALCLHIAARGQTIVSLDDIDLSGLPKATSAKALRYWIDDDAGSLETTTLLKGQSTLDVSTLVEGMHTLHYQVIDENDNVTSVNSALFMKMNDQAIGTETKQLRYWFDDNANTLNTITATGCTQVLDVSHLIDGLHTIHYQVVGNDNATYHIVSSLFMKMGTGSDTNITARKLMYWFDDETAITTVDVSEGVQMLDASRLIDGLHTIHYQVLCSNGMLTSASSSLFMRMNVDAEATTAKQLRYWFDDAQTAVTTSISVGTTMLDASQLIDGLHTVHYQILDSRGSLGAPASSIFIKIDTAASITHAQQLRYWFDDDTSTLKVIDVSKGSQTLDVSELLTGLHTLCYQLVDSEGKVSTPYTRLFMKAFDKVVPDGENRVTKYQYWLNKNNYAMQTVTLDNAANPYQLISLIPMQKEPIHSECFHFEVAEGQPIIYAKNIFHIHFYDAAGYFVDGDKTFVDYGVKQEIENVEELQSGIRYTTVKPGENEVKWYKVKAIRGDSLAFKTDYPCTIQLFSPSGEELYTANGPAAVNYGGSYALEDGTYYLAIHDVTAQNCRNLSIDYQHIDKYAVLSYTPTEVGALVAYLNVTLNGNGYDKLEEVELVFDNNVIKADSLNIISKSLSIARFALTGQEMYGSYDLDIVFKDDDTYEHLVKPKAIEIKPYELGNIEVKVTPSRNTGYPYPVTISVTNTGNVGLLYIPFNIATTFNLTGWRQATSPEESAWASMQPMNFDILYNPIDDSENNSNNLKYSPFTVSYNLLGTGLPGMLMHGLIPALGPHETREYVVGFVGPGHAKFYLYAWAGIPLNVRYKDVEEESNIYSVWKYLQEYEDFTGQRNNLSRAAGFGRYSTITCIDPARLEPVNNALNIADDINENVSRTARNAMAIGLTIGGIHNGLRLRNIQAYTQDDYFAQEVLGDYAQSLYRNMASPGQIAEIAGAPEWLVQLMDMQQRQAGCGNPMPEAHLIDILAPGDPNDIYGYTSDAGSHYMKEGTTDVYYTIEFENDPKIANASAHTIVVKDTLDTNRFDLSTFAAKVVKIGNQEMKLDGEKNFSKRTMDLRPAIDVIAQVSLSLDEKKGIATWTIESLDPMSMELTKDAMQGVLPVNVNGNGLGELTFDIKLKSGMIEGESVGNRAAIKFDQEGVIMTPEWTNIVDATPPVSNISEVTMTSDTTMSVKIAAFDELSKPWKYDLFRQESADGEWIRIATNIPVDSLVQVSVKEGHDYGFYVIVTDSAGNVEQKNAEREYTLEVFDPQIETNTQIALSEGWNWMSHNQNIPMSLDAVKSSATRIVGQTKETIKDPRFSWVGDLDELMPTQMYKLQMKEAANIQCCGLLFNAAFRSVPLYEGWNWIGYPVANVMSLNEALSKFEAEEGDFLIGQDGMATYSDGQWIGTLTEMQPGKGYMYRSVSYKNLFYNASAQSSSRATIASRTKNSSSDEWSINKHKYPNVMAIVASLSQDDEVGNAEDCVIAAFCGDECRGIAKAVDGVLMMNVYGNGKESINFYAMNRDTEEILKAKEEEGFKMDVLGTMNSPYELHFGKVTGITEQNGNDRTGSRISSVYDMQGRRINVKLSSISDQLKKGIYIVTDENNRTKKIVGR